MTEFDSTQVPAARPQVIGWFKAYCGVMALVYLVLLLVMSAVLPAFEGAQDLPPEGLRLMKIFMSAVVAVLMVVFALPVVLAPRPWLWVYGLILICIGMTSACLLPACIPMLIFWLKPEVKAFYGSRV